MASSVKVSNAASPNFLHANSRPEDSTSVTVRDHKTVTCSSDELKFEAGASQQIVWGTNEPISSSSSSSSNFLISSPYNEEGHLLNLRDLDTPDRLLALALTTMKPIRPDYATAPYAESFNWGSIMSTLKTLGELESFAWAEPRVYYVVIFRSRLSPDTDVARLHELDYLSQGEAAMSGGLLKYWFGTRDERLQNLATCLWRSREDARRGGAGPWHRRARGAGKDLYAQITFSTHRLVISEGFENWHFEKWEE
ncbi:hypothetical protein BDY21DRAFT_124415 [Lineolata rhizophorae]|uniref:Uncharacterized protein n=1 Tax=Lineolata rhizophorae TaxID=578093 RepID=A0A6A6NPT0_9PEZI|nr:hypothetical protein BDY21DRAFT_124415 [Lineolata rhizophorae]